MMTKRILAIGHSFVLAQNRDVMRAVHESGEVEVTLLAPRFFHGDLRDLDIEKEPEGSTMEVIPIDCYWTERIHFFTYNLFQIQRLLKRNRYDAVYLWEEPYIVSGFSLAQLFHQYKVPYFFYCSQNIFKKYPWPFSYFERLALQKASGAFACGVGVRRVLEAKGFPTTQVLPLFVSLERFRPFTNDEKRQGLRQLGLAAPLTVGFMGRLVEEKGVGLFQNVAEHLLANHSCNIIVIGSGPLKSSLEKWASDKSNVRLLELRHHEVPSILPLLDILLCPSQTLPNWKEQFGRMIVEAFAAGVAVVGSDSGEIPHVIGEAGLVVPEAELERWTQAVDTLVVDTQQRSVLIQKGLIQAQTFSVKTVAGDLLKSVRSALKWD